MWGQRAAWMVLGATLVATCAWAASSEDAYWAAKTKATAEIAAQVKAHASDKAVTALDDRRRAELAHILRPLLSPPPQGFSGSGTLNPDTLQPDEGSDALDGFLYSNAERTRHVVVSTPALLRSWLDKAMHFKGKSFDAAFRSDDIWTLAINTDAHLDLTAPLPIAMPPGSSLAVAWLGKYEQDFGTDPPDQIAVALITPGRVLMAVVPVAHKLAHIAVCDHAFAQANSEVHASEDYELLENKAEADYAACWQAHAKATPDFAAIVQQAQTLANGLTQH
jgi:hypothetical protein